MTSERKRQANRANAQASSGPKTAKGKVRSAQNAFRHGLNVSVLSDPSLAEEVELWARRIAGAGADPELLAHARRVAETQIEVRRVRTYRLLWIEQALADPHYEGGETQKEETCRLYTSFEQSPGVGRASTSEADLNDPFGPRLRAPSV